MTAQPGDDPLEGHGILRHWSFAYDYDDDFGGGFASGQLLLREDGALLIRYGGSSTSGGVTTWRYRTAWSPMRAWTPVTDPDAALTALLNRGYSVAEPDPTPWDATESGPVDGVP